MKSKQDVINWLEENRQQFIDIAAAIWARPEIAWHEFFASGLQADYLEQQGFRVTRDIAGINTAFVAEWGTGKPVIGFAGEYDALPGLSQKVQTTKEALVEGGLGHGCGHNLLGTAHVAAVVAVKEWIASSGAAGTIRYYGCPAEEAGGAKTFMARAGVFDDLDAAFNFHPMYANTSMKGSMVGVSAFKMRFHGKSSHAGAAPHLGRSALDAVELMNVGLNYLREHVTPDVRMHYIISHGGDAPNIVPHEAEGVYMVRAHQPDNLREVTNRVRKIAQGAALMTETECEEVFMGALSNVLNNAYLADLQCDNMELIGPIDFTPEEMALAAEINAQYPPGTTAACAMSFNADPALFDAPLLAKNFPSMDKGKLVTGSTDVGDLSWKAPLSMITTACFTTASIAHSWGAVVSSNMSFGYKGMLHAAKTMALTAIDLLSDPKHLPAVRSEFEKELALRPYVNPIPAHIQPPRFAPEN